MCTISDTSAVRAKKNAHPIDTVIASNLDTWMPAILVSTKLYAEGVVTDLIAPVTTLAEWPTVADILASTFAPRYPNLSWFDPKAADWEISVSTLHGLAHGVAEHAETGIQCGQATELHAPWYLYPEDFHGTGLTFADFATVFNGDVVAAAAALLRACSLRSIR